MTRRADTQSFDLSLALTERLHRSFPAGRTPTPRATISIPADALPVLVRGEGCRVWDADGNEFIEYGMGLRSVALGHALRAGGRGGCAQMPLGSNFSRPTVLELECGGSACSRWSAATW